MHDPQSSGLIGWLQAMAGGGITTIIAATLGRLVFHGQEVKAGRRPWIGLHLLWEAPTAVFLALGAEALGAWLDLTPTVTTGVVAVVAYLGPRGARDLLERLITARRP